jgi:hypothetical protein
MDTLAQPLSSIDVRLKEIGERKKGYKQQMHISRQMPGARCMTCAEKAKWTCLNVIRHRTAARFTTTHHVIILAHGS